MTLKEAIDCVKRYEAHEWAYEVTDDAVVVIGGQNHFISLQKARDNGYKGPYYRVYS